MNVTRLEQLHQGKSHDETDSRPFQASQNGLKHPGRTLAQATPTLKRTRDQWFPLDTRGNPRRSLGMPSHSLEMR